MEGPSEEDIADTMSAFASKDPEARHIMEAALRVLPRAPRSSLYTAMAAFPGGDDAVSGGAAGGGGVPAGREADKPEGGRRFDIGYAADCPGSRSGQGRGDARGRGIVGEGRAGPHGGNRGHAALGEGAANHPRQQQRDNIKAAAFQEEDGELRHGGKPRQGDSADHEKTRSRADHPRRQWESESRSPRSKAVREVDPRGGRGEEEHGGRRHGKPHLGGSARSRADRDKARAADREDGVRRGQDDLQAGARGGAGVPATRTGNQLSLEIAPEILRFGSVLPPVDLKDVTKNRPLVFHDLHLLRASGAKDGVRLADAITAMLQTHTGPVEYFRLDSFVVKRGCDQLEEWLEMLSRKEVQEVVIVNTRWPADTQEFPLQSLDSRSLRVLRLCFFSIPYIWLPTHDSSPVVLDLTGCRISEGDLGALVRQCKKLRELYIGLWGEISVRIDSESLELLQIWWSAIPYLIIENAPSLKKMTVGAAMRNTSKLTCINIKGPQRLQHVWLNLSSQIFIVNRVTLGQGKVAFSDMRTLELTIAYKVANQRGTLMNFLISCPYLRILIIWRADEPSEEEEIGVIIDDTSARLKKIDCVRSQLQVLTLKSYKGGAAEIVLASSVLEHAAVLRMINIETDADNPEQRVLLERAQQILQRVDRPFAPADMHFS